MSYGYYESELFGWAVVAFVVGLIVRHLWPKAAKPSREPDVAITLGEDARKLLNNKRR